MKRNKKDYKDMLPEVNPREKKDIIEELNKLIKKYEKRGKLRQWYNRNFTSLSFSIILIILSIIITILIWKEIIIIEFSFLLSILAIIISLISLIFRISAYPEDNLTISQLKENEDYYELNFSIKNCGHCKLKLDFVIYYIEQIESDKELTSFWQCDVERMSDYLIELVSRIKNDVIKPYSLKTMIKKYNMFYTYNDTHTERRLYKFEKNKIYLITFLFITSRKIFYYNSKYLKT